MARNPDAGSMATSRRGGLERFSCEAFEKVAMGTWAKMKKSWPCKWKGCSWGLSAAAQLSWSCVRMARKGHSPGLAATR